MTMASGLLQPPALWWLAALRQPQQALKWTLTQWQQVLRQARLLRLLGRLAEQISQAGLLDQVPPQVRRHLVAETRASRWQVGSLLWGLDRVADVLAGTPYARVLLKGAAYIGQGLSISAGRLPSDIDILVPLHALADAQTRLISAGWREPELDSHDQRYYRDWSHEVPPMQHPMVRMELDLHHNILPPVGHVQIDIHQLLTRLQPSRLQGWQVLHPEDQILHSAAHLFYDSELRHRLRDLVDLDGLFRQFVRTPESWSSLQQRAQTLHLGEPLALALHLCATWLDTPVPAPVLRLAVSEGLGRWQKVWLLPLLHSVLMPAPPDNAEPWHKSLASAVLLMRHHQRRLPLRLLVPHVLHKLRASKRSDA
jgi:hypothetical protein